ncbi:hypothetical protein K450DRAFT_260177 [Umbelopsis ramanniana AG]|uniref:Uncharacterized protein n=1 Tax=Umbelopsis ramanniana AG TaxID=1314678 RepID=A0AAD5E164_UMBRA|nr:uncharacterized protein K450DRAFT_260177 [Umbelopsis ramanniana AG]KAI8575788.1 hypothetical protein K450DRAFT_260177 [Umbelopsis ramanniana AG]
MAHPSIQNFLDCKSQYVSNTNHPINMNLSMGMVTLPNKLLNLLNRFEHVIRKSVVMAKIEPVKSNFRVRRQSSCQITTCHTPFKHAKHKSLIGNRVTEE